MEIPTQMLYLIKKSEGLKLERYRDACGNFTVGYGHLLPPNNTMFQITEEEAEVLLMHDAIIALQAVYRLITIPLNENQLSALGDFTYNCGTGLLQASTLRRVINRGDFEDAPEQFARWVYGGARKLPGLIIRRQAEADLFLS